MVFYQVTMVSVLHFRNLAGIGGQDSRVRPKDTLPAVTPALPHQLQHRRPSREDNSEKSKLAPNKAIRKIKLLV